MLVLRPRAKVNLFLEVVARRPDGFHELDTVFAEVDFADVLTATPGAALEVTVEGDDTVPAGETNLAWRAADRLRRAVGRPELGARLAIEKRIPAGGGMGGGSSNAAAALVAFDRLHRLDVGTARLEELAAEIGSDCAFFVEGGVQRGRGRGELLEPLALPPRPIDLVLVFPAIACPTKDVYRALAPHLARTGTRDPRALLEALESGDPAFVAERLWNRLEGPCFELFPAVAREKEELEQAGLLGCLLSGSGSTVFGVARDPGHAESVAAELRGRGKRAVATRAGVARPSTPAQGERT